MIHFWRFHWLWCCCVLHTNLLVVAGEKETVPFYKKMLSDARESVKFSDPKYTQILRGTQTDLRRTGTDIVKKSNDHLEKQTAPNRVHRISSAASENNRSVEEEVALSTPNQNLSISDNASRNARDLSYDTIAVTETATADQSDDKVSAKSVPLNNDSVYSVDNENTRVVGDAILNRDSLDNRTFSTNKTLAISANPNSTLTTSTVSTLVLKNPKNNENKTKIDSNSTFAKKLAATNVKAKNASSPDNLEKPKISGVLLLNDTRYDNSSDYVSDQWTVNETSHNYNVTAEHINSKNITLLTAALGEEKANNETKISATSRRTMADGPSWSTLNIVLLTVAAFAVVSTVSIIGMVSVVLYRRYHWNKPQTLSDKCSNADSTGYIDDSTLKENSEEMYSLDNDSFLNSLEAMTIQNYWADSIRHTKL